MKAIISLNIIVVSTIGGWLGEELGGGGAFGAWSLIVGTLFCFVGVWTGYKMGKWLGK
jgi:hypothetical protein